MVDEQDIDIEGTVTTSGENATNLGVDGNESEAHEIIGKEASETGNQNSETTDETTIPSWAFKKFSKTIKREIQRNLPHEVRQAVTDAINNMVYQQMTPQGQDTNQHADGGKYGDIDNAVAQSIKRQYELVAKAAEAKEAQETHAKWNRIIDEAREKYDDYEAFVDAASPYFTDPMIDALTETPNGLETFKRIWDTNPEAIKKIAKIKRKFKVGPALTNLLRDALQSSSDKTVQQLKSKSHPPIQPISQNTSTGSTTKSGLSDVLMRAVKSRL